MLLKLGIITFEILVAAELSCTATQDDGGLMDCHSSRVVIEGERLGDLQPDYVTRALAHLLETQLT